MPNRPYNVDSSDQMKILWVGVCFDVLPPIKLLRIQLIFWDCLYSVKVATDGVSIGRRLQEGENSRQLCQFQPPRQASQTCADAFAVCALVTWVDQCKMEYVTYIFILVILMIAMVFTMLMNNVGLLLLLLLLLVVAGTVWMTEGQSTVHWQRLLSSLHHSPNHHHHNHHPFDQHHYDYHCALGAPYND